MTDFNSFLLESKNFVLSVEKTKSMPWKGMIYHKTTRQGERFDSPFNMAEQVEKICDWTGVPKAYMEFRRFKHAVECSGQDKRVTGEKHLTYMDRNRAMFKIRLEYRYNASWQGSIERIGTGEALKFSSFLELFVQISEALSEEKVPEDIMYGWVLKMATGSETLFYGTSGAFWYPGKKAVFQIDIKFQRNHTWQGTVRWLQNNEEIQFRSFLELLNITDVAYEDENEYQELQLG